MLMLGMLLGAISSPIGGLPAPMQGGGVLSIDGPLGVLQAVELTGLGRFELAQEAILGLEATGVTRAPLDGGGTLIVRRHQGHVAGRITTETGDVVAFRGGVDGRLTWQLGEPVVDAMCPCGSLPHGHAHGQAGDVPALTRWRASGAGGPPARDGAGDDGAIIDVLAMYTTAALADFDSPHDLETNVLSWFDAGNVTLSDSGINTQLRVVGMELVEGAESGDLLAQFRATADGVFDEAHGLRNGLGADVMVLFVNSTDEDGNGVNDYCGRAYVIKSAGGSPSSACAVIQTTCAATGYTLIHEMGHLHGCAHDAANAGVSGIEPHAYGWVFWGADDSCDDDRWCTVMAYGGLDEIDDCPDEGDSEFVWTQRIGLFSTPDLDHDGTAVGDAVEADNVRVWNDRAPVTAGYRASLIPLDCPGDVDASGEVDMLDLIQMLGAWGVVSGGHGADINEDLQVGLLDLLVLLDRFGRCT